MAEPYLGEIRMFAGNFPPQGWKFCDGTLVPISEYSALYNLIGTTYGGDGQNTFGLPDLRGRVPVHFGSGVQQGEAGGAETVTLTSNQMAAHSHQLSASTDIPTLSTPAGNVSGQAAQKIYRVGNPAINLHPNSITSVGGGQPHDNFQPYLCLTFIIAIEGIFPSQS